MKELTLFLAQDGKFWVATCAEIPEINGQGFTQEEAIEDLKLAMDELFAYRLEAARLNFSAPLFRVRSLTLA